MVQVLKVSLDSQGETVRKAVLVPREREETLVSKVPQEPVYPEVPSRDPKEILDYLVHQVFPVRRVSPDSPVIQDCREEMDAPEFPGHQVPKETLASQEVQVVLEVRDQKATWARWDSQDHRDRKVFLEVQADRDPQDNQEDLVSPVPKVNQALLALGRPDLPD